MSIGRGMGWRSRGRWDNGMNDEFKVTVPPFDSSKEKRHVYRFSRQTSNGAVVREEGSMDGENWVVLMEFRELKK